MDRLPDENGDDPQGLSQDPRAVARLEAKPFVGPPAPSTGDAMALLRQASDLHQAKQGNVTSPAIAANQAAQAINKGALDAMPPQKYSRDGIPDGMNHVDELERLGGLIKMGSASANDIDNYITLQVKQQTDAVRAQHANEAGALEALTGGDGGRELHDSGSDGAVPASHAEGHSAGPTSGKTTPSPMGGRGSVRPGGPNGPQARPDVAHMGSMPSAETSARGALAGGAAGKADQQPHSKPAAKASVTGMSGAAAHGAGMGTRPPDMEPSGSRTSAPGMESPSAPPVASGPSKVAQLSPGTRVGRAERGDTSPDEPSTNAATRAMMADFIPKAAIPLALGAGAMKAGIPGKMAEKVETEMIPGAMRAGRNLASRLGGKAEAEAAPVVNNNISRVSKPPGLAVRDMISEQRAAQAKSGYTPPGEPDYKPPSADEVASVRSENTSRVAAKKAANPNLQSKASQKRAAGVKAKKPEKK